MSNSSKPRFSTN